MHRSEAVEQTTQVWIGKCRTNESVTRTSDEDQGPQTTALPYIQAFIKLRLKEQKWE